MGRFADTAEWSIKKIFNRASMPKPMLLLIDELSLGLSPKITKEIYGTIQKLRRWEVTVLIIEQNATLALPPQ
jgi:branched-chain amino acid transport system ATP-binding protein